MRSKSPRESIFPRIWKLVRRIPRGRVATYGQVAALAGMPRGARVVGYALRAEKGGTLPWQRVIGLRRRGVGHVTIKDPVGGALQRKLLQREGVRFSSRGEVELARYGWRPAGRELGGVRNRVDRRVGERRVGRRTGVGARVRRGAS